MNKCVGKILSIHSSQVTRWTADHLLSADIPGLKISVVRDVAHNKNECVYINIPQPIERLERYQDVAPCLNSMSDLIDIVSFAQNLGCCCIFISDECATVDSLPVYKYKDFTHKDKGQCYVETVYLNGRRLNNILRYNTGYIIEDLSKGEFHSLSKEDNV